MHLQGLLRPTRVAVLALVALPAGAVVRPPPPGAGGPLPDLDVRGDMGERAEPTPGQLAALAALRAELGDPEDLVVRWGPLPGTLHHLFRRDGYLSEPVRAKDVEVDDAEAVARAFARRHADLLGLSAKSVDGLVLGRALTSAPAGAFHLYFEQSAGGVEVFHGELRMHVDRRGRVLSIGGDTAPDRVLREAWTLSAGQALAVAAAAVRVRLAEPAGEGRLDDRGLLRFDRGPFESDPWVDATWFPLADGLVPAWRAVVDPAGDQGWYQVVVDAGTGRVLSRHDLVANVATEGLVFREDPGQGPQLSVRFVDDAVVTDPASPLGWSEAGETRGNNCDVKDDIDADNEGTIGRRAVASGPDPLVFDFPFTGDTSADLDASLTNLFYLNNWLHDRLARMGFDEPAGNFQADNFGRGGWGGDPVRVDAQDGSRLNNASMGTPPDGFPPRMSMHLWTRTNPRRDSGFDSSVVTHELFHGVSTRLVGGPENAGCLATVPPGQPGAMGEGWSDFFACSFWNQVTVGGYLIDNYVRGIRRFAYDQHPFHYGQLCNQGGFEVHRDGEIWAATLWDLRELFVERDGYHGGRCRLERLVLDGMKLAPCRPSYVDMRDAILLAARLNGGAGDTCLLWQGFAARGLGTEAVPQARCTTEDDASFDVPPECADCTLEPPVLTAAETARPNEVTIRFDPAPGAAEHVLVRSEEPCPGVCAGGEFREVARGPSDASALTDTDRPGSRLSDGEVWHYRVLAESGACTSASACIEVTVAGRCTHEPQPSERGRVGVEAVFIAAGDPCALEVLWAPATAACGPPSAVVYDVYRSEDPGFVPGPESLVATVPGPQLSYLDERVPPTAVTYVVRAEDLTQGGPGPSGGNQESNEVRLTRAPVGPPQGTQDFADDAEMGELPGYRRTGDFEPNDWAVVSDGQTRGGSAWHVTGQGGGTADKNIELPPVSLGPSPRLSFVHTFDFEDRFDGGVIEISTDGGRTWTDLLDDFVSGGYTGRTFTVGPLMNAPNTDRLWTGRNPSGFGTYDAVEIDLAPYAGTVEARLRLRCLLDPAAAEPGGWYVDDLVLEDVVAHAPCAWACVDPPVAVLDDASACLDPERPTRVVLSAGESSFGGAAPAADGILFAHDGPGSFDGRRWAAGESVVLTFPAGTPAGDQPVSLTLRDEEGCTSTARATVTLVEGTPPPAPIGDTLRVGRNAGELVLTWTTTGADADNVHRLQEADDPLGLDPSRVVATTGAGTADLSLTDLDRPLEWLRVHAASSCGRSVP